MGNLLLSYYVTCCVATRESPAAEPAMTQNTIAPGDDGCCDEAADGFAMALTLRAPLLRCILELWAELEVRIRAFSPAHAGGSAASACMDGAFLWRLFSDSLGYVGCVMSRLVFGMHHYPAFEAIPCGRRRRGCQRLALRRAKARRRCCICKNA
ncbi:hypothetical protein VaNZ11_011400 [Volvox africanus]|uniref:Uncharacterized protein n=1 Tax=Volvox africanus TaxID=51714 RepID=A0ABQ5SB66_9CHLO|nr:hypothetical protein VaNZ11_011400 [Volvox africanus]